METEVFENANKALDLDVRKDILDNLEGRITIIQGFVRPVRVNSGSNVYALRLKNPEAFKNNVLPKLIAQVENRTEVVDKSFGKLHVQVFEPGRPQREIDAPIRQPEICVTLIDDYVVLADSEYMMRQIADCTQRNDQPTQRVARVSVDLRPHHSPTAGQGMLGPITFARPEESLQLFYELARDPKNRERLQQVSDNNGFFKALLTTFEKHELPPFSVIAKYLAPGGGFLVEEETGLHYMSFSLRRE